jgi:type I restriction enzyme S subunit
MSVDSQATNSSPIENLITEHIDIWSSAIKRKSSSGRGSSKKIELYGIKKLRELILELAVRGKLVSQDASDEPASVLLERIAQEKAQLVKEGKIKKPKSMPDITEDEKPFELPEGWEFVRFNDLGEWGAGATPSRSKAEYYSGKIPWFKSGELNSDYISDSEEHISELALKEVSVRYNNIGDVLVAMYGATIGKTSILSVRAATNQAVCACTPFTGFTNTYLLMLLKASKPRLVGMGAGGAQPNISREKIIQTVIVLPPTEEQHRIVAKVDELMALCDKLEAQTESSLDTHQTLVTVLLDTLVNSQNAEELAENWTRISVHFDTLFTTEQSIDQLKQTILQLAVMGKLVEQSPNDEPASVLLERIAAEKEQFIKDKKYQKSSKRKSKDKTINYPQGWECVQTGEVCPSIVPNRDRPKTFTGNIPWVTLPAFPNNGLYLDHSKVELNLSMSEVNQYSARLIPESSVLMSCVGRFGLTAINLEPVTSNQQVHAFIVLKGLLPEFLSIVIKVEGKTLESVATSTTIAYLNKTNCESIQFGLPPLEEQHRIVAKVDELMAICDQLKARLSDAQSTQLNLADALVEQAL